MKKIVTISLVLALSLTLLAGCGSTDKKADQDKGGGTDSAQLEKLVVGASPTPHQEILMAVKDQLAEAGYDLQVTPFTDYRTPNTALDEGQLDANYFQHQPFLDDFNKENKTDLKGVAVIHYEPFGIYKGKKSSLKDLAAGDIIAVPNDPTNEARALQLLEAQGLIKMKDPTDMKATAKDIVENPKGLKIKELDAAMVARTLPDVAFGIINGNNAILAELDITKDTVATEDKESIGAQTYANVLAVRAEDAEKPAVKALVKALQSDACREFIEKTYKGAVVPVF